MENVVNIILIVSLLIGGIVFLIKYKRIDAAMFGDIERYTPSGRYTVYASAFIGAVLTCWFVFFEMVNKDAINERGIIIVSVMGVIYFCCIVQSIFRYRSLGAIYSRSLWMILSCTLAVVTGMIGSAVILCIGVIFIVYHFVAFGWNMTFGTGKKYKIRASDGTEHTITDRGAMGGQQDELGREWNDIGNGKMETTM